MKPDIISIPDDHDFVRRIADIIPLESEDKKLLLTMISAHRLLHSSKSPEAEIIEKLKFEVQKSIVLHRIIWACVQKLGGTVIIKDTDIPLNWQLETNPNEETGGLTINTSLAPMPNEPK